MTSRFQPPPTWALPILVDEKTQKAIFNPIWLKWFVDLTAQLGGSGTSPHNSLSGLQGGGTGEFYHVTALKNSGIFPTLKVSSAAGYKSSDGSPGYTGTITTASLVGKTVTIKDGIITNIA